MKRLVYFLSLLVTLFAGCASYNPGDFAENNPDVKRVVVGKFVKAVVVVDNRYRTDVVDGTASVVGTNPTASPTVGTIAAALSVLDYVNRQANGQIRDIYIQPDDSDDPVVFRNVRGASFVEKVKPGDVFRIVERKDGGYLFSNMTEKMRIEEKSAKK